MAEKESVGRRLKNGWMAIVARFGFVQTLVLLSFIYVVVIGPVWFVMAISRRDQLAKRGLGEAGTAWQDADTAPPDLERAKLLS